jgi:hypothetical protein
VRESRREVTHPAGVDNENIIARWIIEMLLQIDIVKLGDKIFELLLLQHLLDEVFTVVPSPRLVNLAEILNDKRALADAFLINANCSLSFRMDSESSLILREFIISSE